MKKIIFATGNADKMKEIREILADLDAEILSMKEAGIQADIVEDGKTFEENAVIKATEVMIAAEPVKISARNRIAGTIADISNGAVNGMVLLDIGKGQQISSTISMESIRELDLHVGMEVFAVFKATSVMIGLELDHISF